MRGARMLVRGRQVASDRMTETIRAGSIRDATDESTGNPIEVVGDVVYEGPARVKYTSNAISTDDSSSQVFTSQKIIVSIPVQPATLLPGEGEEPGEGVVPAVNVVLPGGTAVEVLSSTSDPALVGRKYTTDGVPAMGQVTAHRYSVTELD